MPSRNSVRVVTRPACSRSNNSNLEMFSKGTADKCRRTRVRSPSNPEGWFAIPRSLRYRWNGSVMENAGRRTCLNCSMRFFAVLLAAALPMLAADEPLDILQAARKGMTRELATLLLKGADLEARDK